ncbi:hypothetical protein PUN28_011238 [Cardiocondyla obscurior]|uniref:Odorant receptor n=1 Tax=Cardiocondyla obscurior TaxID=286306 RepID=A0AAW2FNF2_9HYME
MCVNSLKFTFALLAVGGCWRPSTWTSPIKHKLYNAYALLIISLMYSFTITQFMEAVLNISSPDDLTDVFYTMVALFSACWKVLNMWVNHESFADLIQGLTKGTFKPLLSIEIEIQRKFDKTIQNNTKRYFLLIIITFFGHVLVSLMTSFRKRQLPFRGWVPYNYSSFAIFCFTYGHQYVGIIVSCFIHVACDSLIVGLLMNLCCQITILRHRLRAIVNGQTTLGDCVLQHCHIIKYAYMTNARCTTIISFQFVASTFLACSNLFHLSRITLNATFIILFAYTFCILIQIFIYCWFGNKIKLMSYHLVDDIFESDWVMLNNKTKKGLLIIMMRAMKPIEFISAHVINMNLNSFVALIRTSYSIYNLLVQMQD